MRAGRPLSAAVLPGRAAACEPWLLHCLKMISKGILFGCRRFVCGEMLQTSVLHQGLMLDLKFDFQVSRQRFSRIASPPCPLPSGERLEHALCSSPTIFPAGVSQPTLRSPGSLSLAHQGCRAHTKSQNC